MSSEYIVLLNMKFTPMASTSHKNDMNKSYERRRKRGRPPLIRPGGGTTLVHQHDDFEAQHERRMPCEACPCRWRSQLAQVRVVNASSILPVCSDEHAQALVARLVGDA